MGTVVGKEACPICRENGHDHSGDNLVRYDDGSAYCFACGHKERGEGQPISNSEGSAKKPSQLLKGLSYRPLIKREIDEETAQKFGYAIGELRGKTVHVAQYNDGTGVVAQKIRDSKKKFSVFGDGKKLSTMLFGQHLWREGGRMITVTEGEIDAMSLSQLQQNKWPVVSVPTGAKGAAKAVAAQLEFLESFDKVVFMFDMDEPGQEAARECAELLKPGKAYIARTPMKDANMCLVEGKGRELLSSMWDAKPFRPDGVISIADVTDLASQDVKLGLPWPWESLTKATYGRRRAELYGIGAGTGIGKSTLFKQIAKHIVEEDNLPVGMIMLEEPPHLTGKTMAGMFMQKRVHIPGVEYDREELRNTLLGLEGKVYLYDHYGSMQWSTIKNRIRYMVRALGIKDIFLDHLTALAAAFDADMDERKAIDKVMAELSSLVQELDCTIYYISHLTTPDGKPHEEGGRVFEKHFRGSRSIAYWSHYMFAMERDKQSDDPTTFRCLKDRYTGDAAGLTFGLCYDTDTGLYDECELPSKDKEPAFDPDEDGEY